MNFILLQVGLRSTMQSFLQDWVQPVWVALCIAGFAWGLIGCIELIADKNERGTTKDGWMRLIVLAIGCSALLVVGNYGIKAISSMSMNM